MAFLLHNSHFSERCSLFSLMCTMVNSGQNKVFTLLPKNRKCDSLPEKSQLSFRQITSWLFSAPAEMNEKHL